jgi:hypothetical protein
LFDLADISFWKILPYGSNSQSWRSAFPSNDFPLPTDGSGSLCGGYGQNGEGP